MNVRALFEEDRAVSPVIGVVLMVAITVLLAATAASFFLGFSDQQNARTPQAAFSFDYDAGSGSAGDALTVGHTGGDSIDAGNLYVVVDGATYDDGGTREDLTARKSWAALSAGTPGKISAGMSVSVDGDSLRDGVRYDDLSLRSATVRVVWSSPDNARTFVLNSWSRGG
ncbi:MAG: type IV pilin [Haloarculaceae archaeon]